MTILIEENAQKPTNQEKKAAKCATNVADRGTRYGERKRVQIAIIILKRNQRNKKNQQ